VGIDLDRWKSYKNLKLLISWRNPNFENFEVLVFREEAGEMAGSKDAPITTVIEASNLSEEHKLKATPPASSWTVLVQGVALFSDGYNVQIIGYMESVLKKL